MTREEAINIMSQMIKDEEGFLSDNTVEAHKMAIKALEQEPKILNTLDFAIDASNGDTNYFVGFRNGLRYSKSLIDGKEPQFESCTEQEPCEDMVSRGVLEQVRWERDIAISQLKELGYGFGEKIEPCEDAISRKIISAFLSGLISDETERKKALQYINELPSVNPQPCQEKWIDEDDNRYICKECEYAHKPQKEPCEG